MAKKNISLLTSPPFNLTIQGRIITWLTTWGRAVLVLVELVVISAFFSRFWLDRKNSDLADDIRQKKAVLEDMSGFEKDFRSIQTRLSQASTIMAQEEKLTTAPEVIARCLPEGVIVKQISFNLEKKPKTANVDMVTYSEQGLSIFIAKLLEAPEVGSVSVGTVKKEKISSGIEIKLTLEFKENESSGQ